MDLGQDQTVVELQLGPETAQEQEPLQVEMQAFQRVRQISGDQQLNAVVLDPAITGLIPPSDVGTDRYLSAGPRSTRDANQVHRGFAPLLLDMSQRLIGH